MIYMRFAIYDDKAEAHIPEFLERTRGVAIRKFQYTAQKEGSDFNNFAADYTLFETGTWDDQTARSKNHTAPINLGTALHWKSKGADELPQADDQVLDLTNCKLSPATIERALKGPVK